MKHLKKNRTLGRTASKRQQLWSNLVSGLLVGESITTTRAKASEFKKIFEPLITEAKSELTLHRRRRLLAKLKSADELQALVDIAKKNIDRPGGYLRLTGLPESRGDGAKMVKVELV